MNGTGLVPLGQCPVCGQGVPGGTDKRYMLCKVRLSLHVHPTIPDWCIGSNSLAKPVTS